MTPPDELRELRERIAELESLQRRRRRWLVGVVCAGIMWAGALAWGANGNCPNGMPFCFSAGQPAVATDINQNFAQLKEWVEAKVGAVGSPTQTASLQVTGATVFDGNVTVNGPLTSGNAVTLNGSVLMNGYQVACANGTDLRIFPFCCRTNIRNGQTSCRISTSWPLTAPWVSGPVDPFSAGPEGRYSISCFSGVDNINFPGCCLANDLGQVRCRSATNWQLTAWSALGTAF